jgi:DNA-binding response OmpR family regulator
MEASILLVEDDDSARAILHRFLVVSGYDVCSVATGQQAIEQLTHKTFDGVVSDIFLPDIDGLEVLRVATKQAPAPTVLLLTGHRGLDHVIAALRAGANDYLLKPCVPTTLLERLDQALHQRSLYISQESILKGYQTITRESPMQHISESLPSHARSRMDNSSPSEIPNQLRFGKLVLSKTLNKATYAGRVLHLTPIEHKLLRCLIQAEGRVVSYIDIVKETHKDMLQYIDAHVLLKSHVRNIRRKTSKYLIRNVRQIGYRIVAD